MNQFFPGQTGDLAAEERVSRLSQGAVLLARDILQDPNFESSTVLICLHSKEGAYGLVLNRPSYMPLSEIFDGFKGLDLKREIFIGGPVQQEQLQVVQVTDEPMEGAFAIKPRVYMGGNWESIIQMIETDPSSTHLFLGYSGWGPGQLEEEIRAGAWDVYQVDLGRLLLDSQKLLFSDSGKLASYLEELKEQPG
ncbi:MAG: YqgE/AlgH family protein [Fibrobacter sp.]|jgi:putative transcriptional regulator|nr:YqgE/AlgH family protein [Fibrobacter sp.]